MSADKPFKDMVHPKAYALFEDKYPLRLAKLERAHDYVLLPTLRLVSKVRQEEEEKRRKGNKAVLKSNRRIKKQQEWLLKKFEMDLKPLVERLATVEEGLHSDRQAASETVGEAGGSFDPRKPDEACLFAGGPKAAAPTATTASNAPAAPARAAVESALKGLLKTGVSAVTPPWLKILVPGLLGSSPTAQPSPLPARTSAGMPQMPAALSWVTTAGTALMIGGSLGLLTGILERDTMSRHPMELLMFAMIGGASAIGTRFSLSQAWYLAGRQDVESSGRDRFIPKALASAITMLVILVDGFVEKSGLLKMAQSNDVLYDLIGRVSLPVRAASDSLYWFAAIIVIFGFALSQSFFGWNKGRNEAKADQTDAKADQADAVREAADAQGHAGAGSPVINDPSRQDPKMKAALAAISRVCVQTQLRDDLKARIKELTDAYNAAVAQLEARREKVLDALPVESLNRIQDAIDSARGAQGDWDAQFEAVLNSCSVGGAH